ncbi:MAG TPA: calcium-binding protein [Caulobacteraceae bacterium]
MTLIGTGGDDSLVGGSGGDSLYGADGGDTLRGGGDRDLLLGQDGDDLLDGGEANDTLIGGPGDDTLLGGAGFDWADYGDAASAVIADLSLKAVQDTGGGGIDRFDSIEQLCGSGFNDRFTGDNAANQLVGANGDDTLAGGGGGDSLIGGDGNDVLISGNGRDYLAGGAGDDTYLIDRSGDYISEKADSGIDTVRAGASCRLKANLEALELTGAGDTKGWGNDLSNTMTGNRGDNLLFANGGDDSIHGGRGDDLLGGGQGNDLIDGGEGRDTASFNGSMSGVTADLNIAGAQDTGRGFDTLVSIENLIGSPENDTLTGDGGDNELTGHKGADFLYGGEGSDTLNGGSGDDFLSAGGGGDVIKGGVGVDTVSFGGGVANLTVDLRLQTAQDTGAGMMVLKSVENLIGGIGADDFTANGEANNFNTGPGDDIFRFFTTADLDGDSITKLRGSGFDRIDLSGIDADETADGDQAFTLVGAFTGQAGEAVYHYELGGSEATLDLDVDGDGLSDAHLTITGNDFGDVGFVL